MRSPALRGVIDRRILVNFRVDPSALARVLPAPFRPQLVRGSGLAGICLIRLARMRPPCAPKLAGVASENAAHRIAVEWDEGGRTKSGVFIPRRDTSSRLNRIAGGLIFPGEYHRARFEVEESDDRYRVDVWSEDRSVRIGVEASLAAEVPRGSVFGSMIEASSFFERGSAGYSPGKAAGTFDEISLEAPAFHLEPLAPTRVVSSWFADPERFPRGSVELDSAFLMRDVEHAWRSREALLCA